MTPVRSELRRFSSLLLNVYGLAADLTEIDIRVDQGVEGPVWLAFRCCRGDLERLTKEESK